MRRTLADWKAVRDQYTVVEDIFRGAGALFLYNTPYFPQLNGPIEHLWRYGKGATRRRAQSSLRASTEAFEQAAFGQIEAAHLRKWQRLVRLYARYYSLHPGVEITDHDILSWGQRQLDYIDPPPLRSLYRLLSRLDLRDQNSNSRAALLTNLWAQAHQLNVRARQGDSFVDDVDVWDVSEARYEDLRQAATRLS